MIMRCEICDEELFEESPGMYIHKSVQEPTHKHDANVGGSVGSSDLLAAREAPTACPETTVHSSPLVARAACNIQTLREEKLSDDDLYNTATSFRDYHATTIAHILRGIRDQAYSVGYRHGYADAVTDLEA
jgi:hypothetical protein